MGEVKQETSPKSKSQHLQQTSSLQTKPFSEQSIASSLAKETQEAND